MIWFGVQCGPKSSETEGILLVCFVPAMTYRCVEIQSELAAMIKPACMHKKHYRKEIYDMFNRILLGAKCNHTQLWKCVALLVAEGH